MLVKLTTDKYCQIPVSDVIGKPLMDDEETGEIRRGNEGELSSLTGIKTNQFALEDFTKMSMFLFPSLLLFN
jgi:hypothetical protein